MYKIISSLLALILFVLFVYSGIRLGTKFVNTTRFNLKFKIVFILLITLLTFVIVLFGKTNDITLIIAIFSLAFYIIFLFVVLIVGFNNFWTKPKE